MNRESGEKRRVGEKAAGGKGRQAEEKGTNRRSRRGKTPGERKSGGPAVRGAAYVYV